MATDPQQYERVVTTYATQQAKITSELLRLLLALWLPFTWWGRPDMVNAAAAQSAAYVDIATRRVRRLSRAHMLAQLRLIGAEPDRLPPIEDTYERGGTPIVEVYKRPARQIEHMIREQQKALDTLEAPARLPMELPARITDEMMRTFEERLTSLVEDDIAATARDEAQKVLWVAPKVIGYRRVIHPEFSKTGTCGLCVVASSKFYTKGELMPLHDKCKCTISPITANQDLGLRLNREDLDAIYKAAGSNYAEDLKRITVQIREHGELGPILTQRGTKFRDVKTVNKTSKRQKFTPYKRMTPEAQRRMWLAHKDTSERSIRILEAARDEDTNLVDIAGTGVKVPVRDIEQAIQWHRALIARALSNLA